MDNTDNRPVLDTSVKKLAILADGETAFITGRGLAVAGSKEEIDVTDIDPDDEKLLRENLHDVRVERKGDKITLRPRTGRAITLKERKQNDA